MTENKALVITDGAPWETEESGSALVRSDDTFRDLGDLQFVLVGTLEWTELKGKAFGPVAEAARDVFTDSPGAVSRLDVDVLFDDEMMYGGRMTPPRVKPRHSSVKVSMEQPRLYVYRVQRGDKALGLVFLNKGMEGLGDIGE